MTRLSFVDVTFRLGDRRGRGRGRGRTSIKQIRELRACLHEAGGPQVGVVACGGLPHLTCKRDPIKMRDYMDGRVTPPKRVTSPSWGPPPSCKQVLSLQCALIQSYTLPLHLLSKECYKLGRKNNVQKVRKTFVLLV